MAADQKIPREAKLTDCDVLVSLMKESSKEQGIMITGSQPTAEDLRRDCFGTSITHLIVFSEKPEDEIVGYLLYCSSFSGSYGRVVTLRDVFVVPSYRRRGIGTLLWKEMIKKALENGSQRCYFYAKCSIEGLPRVIATKISRIDDELCYKMDKSTMDNFIQSDEVLDGIQIRRATPNDCPQMSTLIQALYDHLKQGHTVKTNASVLCTDGYGDPAYFHAYVATKDDGALVGYTIFYFLFGMEGHSVFMEDLYVKPEYRAKRIGAALWKSVIKDGVAAGCKNCIYIVNVFNPSAIKFYNNRGAVDTTKREGMIFYSMIKDAMENLVKD